MPSPFALPSNVVDVVFQSDDLGHGKFNISYSIKPCGGYITGQSQGVIASPNYPDPYNHNDYCIWLIEADPGHSIQIHWDAFDVEGATGEVYNFSLKFSKTSVTVINEAEKY